MWVTQWRLMLVRNYLKRLLKIFTSKSQVANAVIPLEVITKNVNEIIAKYTIAKYHYKLIAALSVNRPTASNAITIHDS